LGDDYYHIKINHESSDRFSDYNNNEYIQMADEYYDNNKLKIEAFIKAMVIERFPKKQ